MGAAPSPGDAHTAYSFSLRHHANADTDCHGNPIAPSNQGLDCNVCLCSNPYHPTKAIADGHTDGRADTDTDNHTDAHTDTHANTNTDNHAGARLLSQPNTDEHTDTQANTNTDTHHNAGCHVYADTAGRPHPPGSQRWRRVPGTACDHHAPMDAGRRAGTG